MSSERKIDVETPVVANKPIHHETFEDFHVLGQNLRRSFKKRTMMNSSTSTGSSPPSTPTSGTSRLSNQWGQPIDDNIVQDLWSDMMFEA